MANINVNITTTLLGDTDTPNSYVGEGGKFLAVKADESGTEFKSVSSDLIIDTTPITGGSTGAIFYEKVDHTFGEIMGFQYDDSNKTLSYFDDLVSPEVGMLVGKLEIMPGVFIPYSGLLGGNNPMTDMGIAYLDATLIGAQKTIFLGNQFGTRLTIENQNVNIDADQNVNINADQIVNIDAYQYVSIYSDGNIYLDAGQIVNINAEQYVHLEADQYVQLKADANKTLSLSEDGFQLINTMGGVDSRFQYSITDGVTPDQFGIFGASPVNQQPLSIDPSTLPTSNDTEKTVKEIAQALINYGLLTL